MSLIDCSECGKKISSQAISCPACGNPEMKIGLEKTDEPSDLHVGKVTGNNDSTLNHKFLAGLSSVLVVIIILSVLYVATKSKSGNSNEDSSPSVASSTVSDNALFTDPRIKVELNGTAKNALNDTGGGMLNHIWLIQMTVANATKSPLTLNGTNHIEDSEGNSYTGTTDNGNGSCINAFTDWTATINPNVGTFVTACYDVPDGLKFTRFWVTDTQSGKLIFSIPLNQTLHHYL